MANKNVRINGKFISNEMQKIVKELAKDSGLNINDYAKENNELLGELNGGGGYFEARVQMDNSEKIFDTYNDKNYTFVNIDGTKVNYEYAMSIMEGLANSRGTSKDGGLIYAQFNYEINVGKKQIIADFEQLQEFIELLENEDWDNIDPDYFDALEFAMYEAK